MSTKKRFQCDDCRRLYQLQKRKLGGLEYQLYVCPGCEDTLFTMEQTKAYREVHELAKLSLKPLGPLMLRRVGNSLNATVPKELAAVGFEPGQRFQWEIQGPGKLTLQLLDSEDPVKPGVKVSRKKKVA